MYIITILLLISLPSMAQDHTLEKARDWKVNDTNKEFILSEFSVEENSDNSREMTADLLNDNVQQNVLDATQTLIDINAN